MAKKRETKTAKIKRIEQEIADVLNKEDLVNAEKWGILESVKMDILISIFGED